MVKDDKRDVIITSCCHSVNLLIQKYFPEYAAVSCGRIVAYARALRAISKRAIANAKVVFVGPCVVKKGRGGLLRRVR